jgi:putative membrane protein
MRGQTGRTTAQGRDSARPGDRSALDRTFASWVRTGMALAALGFIVLRLGYYLEEIARAAGAAVPFVHALTTPVGMLHLFAGTLMILLAGLWHRDSARRLVSGDEDARRFAPAVVVALTAASVVGGGGLAIDLLLALAR